MEEQELKSWTTEELEDELSIISEALSYDSTFSEWLDLLHDHVQITLELTRRGGEGVSTD